MKTPKKIAQKFKAMFEGNRCRFAKGCELYQNGGLVCNNLFERFLNEDKAYCGKYRSKEDEEKK